MLLKPLNLADTANFLAARGIHYSKKQVLDLFMVMGGIPHYLKQIQRSKSITQNINDICFTDDGVLYNEFDRLFVSLFTHSENHMSIINALVAASLGLSVSEIAIQTKIKKGGRLTQRLRELEKAGFIKKVIPLGGTAKQFKYRIIDEYTHFYAKWIKPHVERGESPGNNHHWQSISKSASWYSWAGLAFERVCFKHASAIAKTLGIEGTGYHVCDWEFQQQPGVKARGAQIDMIFDREDDAITIIDAKYCKQKFSVDKATAINFANKLTVLSQNYPTDKHITFALITSSGHKESIWSHDLIDHFVDLEDLFS